MHVVSIFATFFPSLSCWIQFSIKLQSSSQLLVHLIRMTECTGSGKICFWRAFLRHYRVTNNFALSIICSSAFAHSAHVYRITFRSIRPRPCSGSCDFPATFSSLSLSLSFSPFLLSLFLFSITFSMKSFFSSYFWFIRVTITLSRSTFSLRKAKLRRLRRFPAFGNAFCCEHVLHRNLRLTSSLSIFVPEHVKSSALKRWHSYFPAWSLGRLFCFLFPFLSAFAYVGHCCLLGSWPQSLSRQSVHFALASISLWYTLWYLFAHRVSRCSPFTASYIILSLTLCIFFIRVFSIRSIKATVVRQPPVWRSAIRACDGLGASGRAGR